MASIEEKLPLSPSSTEFDDDVNTYLMQRRNDRSRRRSKILHWFFHVFAVVLIGAIFARLEYVQRQQDHICNLKHNAYSPALGHIRDTYELVDFEGGFNGWTPFKGPPSDEVNAAWSSIIDIDYVNVTAEQMVKMGRSLDSAQFPKEMGGGYMGLLESAHHLHCLNSLWRDHHISYFPKEQKMLEEMPDIYMGHYEHCVDMLRQRLMCTSDTGLITFNWVEHVGGPYPNFNTAHKCKSYDDILKWNKANDVPLPEDYEWIMPEDAVKLPHAP